MPSAADQPRLIVLANLGKPSVAQAMEDLCPWLRQRAQVIVGQDGGRAILEAPPRPGHKPADFAIILGGDGTMLAQARRLIDHQIPFVGINFGKLGFLAEFSLQEFQSSFEAITSGKIPSSRHVLLDVRLFERAVGEPWVVDAGARGLLSQAAAINDVVLMAGEPFRMIDMEFVIDQGSGPGQATKFAGDGVIVSTPLGSTAYNLSAGGPIVSPDVAALCITPLCPHSLAFRPIVVSSASAVVVRADPTNAGSAVVIDGQVTLKFHAGHQILIRQYAHPFLLVHNPAHDYWSMLAQKLHWAARPRSG